MGINVFHLGASYCPKDLHTLVQQVALQMVVFGIHAKFVTLSFQSYAAGTNPADTKYRGKMMMYDVPGEIGGVSIAQGDLVFGDTDGIIVIPSQSISQVVNQALSKVSAENTVRDEIRAGDTLVDIFSRHKIL